MKQLSKPAQTTARKKVQPDQPFMAPAETDNGLYDLFVGGLREMYWGENHLVKAIPKMIAAAGSANLKKALTNHLKVTRTHATRLENAFGNLGETLLARKCDACEGLVMSGEHVIENTDPGTSARDTGIIMSALKVENFEITSYTGLIKLAQSLSQSDVSNLLQENLNEETDAANQLNALS